MFRIRASGVEAGQRKLNGPQTTGRDYRNLSPAVYRMRRFKDVRIRLRDGTCLLADVCRPVTTLAVPALVAAAPYPRQIQDLGLPAGLIEAGATDFWVPRGYAHVIVNLRGTCGSDGTWTFFDAQERRDLHDVVEWVADQPWCTGDVGMIGISYYAMTQLAAATERPPHLKALFPFHVTTAAYDAARHNGLYSSAFMISWLSALAFLAPRNQILRNVSIRLIRRLLLLPVVHRRFATFNGEGALTALRLVRRAPHAPHPWDDLLRACADDHPTRDAWWDERDVTSELAAVRIPVYLGSDWTNVPMHLAGTFDAWDGLCANTDVRMAVLGEHGLPWPWESMHVEALAWFDQWLKGRQTGIMAGPPIRFVLPGARGWQEAAQWPPQAHIATWTLSAEGSLRAPRSEDDRAEETLRRFDIGSGKVQWVSDQLVHDLDVVGHGELVLEASTTAEDTGWIALLEDLAPDGTPTAVTQGWLQATLREVDEAASVPGRPVLPSRRVLPVDAGAVVRYRIPLVATARRFAAGHQLRLTLTSNDRNADSKPMLGFSHTPVCTVGTNVVYPTSRLLLPIYAGTDQRF